MYYGHGTKKGLAPLGKILGVMYAFMLMGGGGGNMFQVNQTAEALNDLQPRRGANMAVGIMMVVVVGMVIIGGGVASAQLHQRSPPSCADSMYWPLWL